MTSSEPVFPSFPMNDQLNSERTKEVKGGDVNSVDRRRMANPDSDGLDLEMLLHPANAFDRPADVVKDPDLTLSEKRAILASWASDACASKPWKADPGRRRTPGYTNLPPPDGIGGLSFWTTNQLGDVVDPPGGKPAAGVLF